MFEFSILQLAEVTATFFAAGLVTGVTGMGLPTVAMGVLGTLISPVGAASVLLVPSFVTNVWQLLAGPNVGLLLRRLWPMMLPLIAGTVLGSAALASEEVGLTTTMLGMSLILYSGYTLLCRPFIIPHRIEIWMSPVIGAVTGAVTGGTGVFVIPAVPYLQALGLSKDDLVQALGLSFTVSTLALAVGLGAHGAFQLEQLFLSGLAVVPALGGMWTGQCVRSWISPTAFRRAFLTGLLLLGFEMVARKFF
jgi:hypothetical protein